MGTYYAFAKRTGRQFAWERIKRLFLPLVFGMLVIVPPQVYIEHLTNDRVTENYFDYWPSQAFIGVYPEGNLSWHHLWFLPYLLLFSLSLLPVFSYLKKHPESIFLKRIRLSLKNPWGLFLFLPPLYLCEALLEPFFPITHAFIGDWFIIISSSFLFFFGFILIAVKDVFWPTVARYRRKFLACALIGFTIWLAIVVLLEDSTLVHFTEAFVKVFNLWSWILTFFGYAAVYLNTSNKFLTYANEAVYPFYIMHQTITIIIGYYLMDLDWGFSAKASLMVFGTFGGTWIFYELGIRRWNWIRPFFGLK